MKLKILKRAGMLAASAAVCYCGVFGALTLNGLRYVRPTAENWSLLAYIEPAARIEQEVVYMSTLNDAEPKRTNIRITGYDAQERQIWLLNFAEPFRLTTREQNVYSDGMMTTYYTVAGTKETSYTQFDARGRKVREEDSRNVTVYSYRGEENEPYLTETYNVQGTLVARGISAYDPATGETTLTSTMYDAQGVSGTWVTVRDSRGHSIFSSAEHTDYASEERFRWEYDDAARTAVCNREDGSIETAWYDEQERVVRDELRGADGSLRMMLRTDCTDITR